MTLYTHLKSSKSTTPGHDRKKSKSRSVAYDAKPAGKLESVYSSQSVITITYSAGVCEGCGHDTGSEQVLVNRYCPICCALGANESQCLNPRDINGKVPA